MLIPVSTTNLLIKAPVLERFRLNDAFTQTIIPGRPPLWLHIALREDISKRIQNVSKNFVYKNLIGV